MSDLHTGYDQNTWKIQTKFWDANKELINTLDALVLAGDLASHSHHQRDTLFRELRLRFPDLPILVVYGNHDFWSQSTGKDRYPGYPEIVAKQEKSLAKYNVHHFSSGSVEIRSGISVKFWGLDGWYNRVQTASNDRSWMRRQWQTTPPDPFEFLISKACKEFNQILEEVDEDSSDIRVIVTHFPPLMFLDDRDEKHPYYLDQRDHGGIQGFFEPIKERFDYALLGHFHSYYDQTYGKCRFLTTGGNYNSPRLNVIEINS